MNRLLQRGFKLPLAEKILFGEAFLLLMTTRLVLWLVPFKFFRRNFVEILVEEANFEPVDWRTIDKIAGSVKTASRFVPFASCLTQALAGFWLIRLNGQHSELKIGVAKTVQKKLAAHAWLEINGRVILGNSPSRRKYTILNSFAG